MAMFHVVLLCLRLLYDHGVLDSMFETIVILCLVLCFGYCPCFGGSLAGEAAKTCII
jgi:hypothetical protein